MEIGVTALTATFGTQYTYGSFATALCTIYIINLCLKNIISNVDTYSFRCRRRC